MTASARFGGIVVAAAAMCGVAQAQDKITFYENGYYAGYSFTLRESEPNFGRPGLMNDQASSMRVTGRWLICSDGNYNGRCEEVTEDSSNLGEFRLNDALSSAKYLGPIKPRVTTPPPPTIPVAVQREMLQRKILDALAEDKVADSLKLFSDYRALGSPAPKMLVMEAKAALLLGDKKRVSQVLTQYFNAADSGDEDYADALDLYELANKP